jgi:hypothetical protein
MTFWIYDPLSLSPSPSVPSCEFPLKVDCLVTLFSSLLCPLFIGVHVPVLVMNVSFIGPASVHALKATFLAILITAHTRDFLRSQQTYTWLKSSLPFMEIQSLWLFFPRACPGPYSEPHESCWHPLTLLKFSRTLGLTVKIVYACLISHYVLQVSI